MRLVDPKIELASALLADGYSLAEASRQTGLTDHAIRYALNWKGYRDRERTRVRTPRGKRNGRSCHPRFEAKRNTIEWSDEQAAARAYTKPDEPTFKPSLPRVSIQNKPSLVTEQPRFRIASVRRPTENPGADRWRQIHQDMIRAGKLPPKDDIVSEMHR